MYARIEELAAQAIRELLLQLEAGTAPRIPQDETLATYRRRRTEADGEIDWQAPTRATYNLVRALARPYVVPTPGRRRPRRRLARPPAGAVARGPEPPGTVLAAVDGALAVRTGDDHLLVTEYVVDAPIAVGTLLGGAP